MRIGNKLYQGKKIAVGLQYQPEQIADAPKLVAKGYDHLAEQIVAIARKNDIPVKVDADLAQLLAASEVGEFIPPEAFMAVASILRIIYQHTPQRKPELIRQQQAKKELP